MTNLEMNSTMLFAKNVNVIKSARYIINTREHTLLLHNFAYKSLFSDINETFEEISVCSEKIVTVLS